MISSAIINYIEHPVSSEAAAWLGREGTWKGKTAKVGELGEGGSPRIGDNVLSFVRNQPFLPEPEIKAAARAGSHHSNEAAAKLPGYDISPLAGPTLMQVDIHWCRVRRTPQPIPRAAAQAASFLSIFISPFSKPLSAQRKVEFARAHLAGRAMIVIEARILGCPGQRGGSFRCLLHTNIKDDGRETRQPDLPQNGDCPETTSIREPGCS
ncbi:hypothetical protein VTK26DRAFT_8401 [Humicola hyalothermophila]